MKEKYKEFCEAKPLGNTQMTMNHKMTPFVRRCYCPFSFFSSNTKSTKEEKKVTLYDSSKYYFFKIDFMYKIDL